MSKALENLMAGLKGRENEPEAKALIALQKIGESMAESADTERKGYANTIASLRAKGNNPMADQLQKVLDAMPTATRGLSADDARKQMEPYLATLNGDFAQIVKLGCTKFKSDKYWQLYQQPAKEKAEAKK
jgi:hypothetical protein